VRCALGAISHRDGVHGWLPDTGKSSLSSFKTLDYCEKSQTSLVECRPYTGRTHQLRLHLSLIGNPIANDPCYGGELFYNDTDSKEKALATLAEMKRTGQVPLTRVPHVSTTLKHYCRAKKAYHRID
jgi:23S rRNA-/tRNA-specific pseudouridylate synthase